MPTGVVVVAGRAAVRRIDPVAVEEPLDIRVTHGPVRDRRRVSLAVTMRTPGDDADLAAGFLFAEGVVSDPGQILGITAGGEAGNVVRVELHPAVALDLARLGRHTLTTSACGVCGKTTLDAVEAACDGPAAGGVVAASVIPTLPDLMRAAQPGFARTGGVHAAGLFTLGGEMLAVREDVGRHNALDKLIGAEFRAGRVPLAGRAVVVSGRAGFELVQKSAMAGVPVLAAVGAPTTLAVDLARRLGVTLLGFVRDGRFTVYSGAERVGGLTV